MDRQYKQNHLHNKTNLFQIGQLREQLQKREMSSDNYKRLMEVEADDKRTLKEEVNRCKIYIVL